MVKVCLQCGGEGFFVAFVHCRGCNLHVVHRYCLQPVPDFQECVLWFCEDCEPKFAMLSQSKKHPILVRGSDYATLVNVPSSTKARVLSSTKVDEQRLQVKSSTQNVKAKSTKKSAKNVDSVIQNGGSRSQVKSLQTDLAIHDAEVQPECIETFDSNEKHGRRKRLRSDDEGEASLRNLQPLEVTSSTVGEKDTGFRRCNSLEKDASVELAEPLTGKESVKTSDSKGNHEECKRLKIDDQNEAMVEHIEPPAAEYCIKICNSNGKHEGRERLKRDNEHEVSPQPLEVNTCKVGEQDRELGRCNSVQEEVMVEQAEPLTAENSFKIDEKHGQSRLKKDEKFETSPCELHDVISSKAGEQDGELGRYNSTEDEPLTGKDAQVDVCEDMKMDHAVHNNLEEGVRPNEANPNNRTNNHPHVPVAPPIKDSSWRGSLSVIDRVFGTSTQLVAHLSSLACPQATKATNSLPKLLLTELLPRLDVWPKRFQKCSPSGDAIALYFFHYLKCDEKIFDKLVQRMINQDLGIKSVLEDAELLVFPSTLLTPKEYWNFKGKVYLWGFFRGKQPSNAAGDVSNGKIQAETHNTPSPIILSEPVAKQPEMMSNIPEKLKLNGTNFLNWFRNLRIVLRANMLYVLERPIPNEPALTATQTEKDAFRKHQDDASRVKRLMLCSLEPELQNQLENLTAFDMIERLRAIFHQEIMDEISDILVALIECKMVEGSSVGSHVPKMIGHIKTLEHLGQPLSKEVAVHRVMQSLPETFRKFVMDNSNRHDLDKKSLPELLDVLLIAERNFSDSKSTFVTVDEGVKNKRKFADDPSTRVSKKIKAVKKDVVCHNCNEKGHFKSNCPKYREELAEAKGRTNHSNPVPPPKGVVGKKKVKGARDDVCHHCNIKGHWKRNCPKHLKELAEAKRSGAGAKRMNVAREA